MTVVLKTKRIVSNLSQGDIWIIRERSYIENKKNSTEKALFNLQKLIFFLIHTLGVRITNIIYIRDQRK